MNETKSGPDDAVSSAAPAGPPAPGGAALWRSIEEVSAQLAHAADAQFAIWKMKLVRRITLMAASVFLMAACLGLIIYGFVLLDKTFDFALQNAAVATWFSPLVRGSLYVIVPLLVAWRESNRVGD